MRVTLLEAGGRGLHPNIAIPAAFAKQFHTKLDWDYATEPEPHCDGRSLYLPRGKGLGGSSGMNAMLYVRGRAAGLRPLGRARLGLGRRAALLPALRGQRPRRLGAPRDGGPLRVADERSPRPLTGALPARPRSRPGSRASTTTTGPSRTAPRPCRSPSTRAGAGARTTRTSARPQAREPRGRDRCGRAAGRRRRRPRDRRARAAAGADARASRAGARGDPGGRRVRLAATADALRRRPCRRTCSELGIGVTVDAPERRPATCRTTRTSRLRLGGHGRARWPTPSTRATWPSGCCAAAGR